MEKDYGAQRNVDLISPQAISGARSKLAMEKLGKELAARPPAPWAAQKISTKFRHKTRRPPVLCAARSLR